MKSLLPILTLLLVILLTTCSPVDEQPHPLQIMTFNVRLNLVSDGDNAWPNRKEMAASMIRFYEPDIFGVQEALEDQVTDLSESLPQYAWIGVGRDDGKQAGEYMAIFYLKHRFKVLKENTCHVFNLVSR